LLSNKKTAIKVIKKLRSNGFEALLAGGCVRDMLLGRAPKDFDIATSAKPKDVIGLFKRTLKVGAHFGVIIVLDGNKQVEVATFRTESDYNDGRHPAKVKFTVVEEDATRRDFTINGMFYDPIDEKILDYINGQTDLIKRIVRTIGEPQHRFCEDYLRMMRAVRFSTQLDFRIEPKTWKAIGQNAKKIVKISDERKQTELEGILVDPHRSRGVTMLVKSGLAEAIFPEMDLTEGKFAIKVLSQLPKRINFPLGLASFFAGCETKFAMEKCVALRLSRKQNHHVRFLLAHRDTLLAEKMSLSQLRRLVAEPYFSDLFELQKAILKSKPGGNKGLAVLKIVQKRIDELNGIALKPEPLLDGHDLIRLGATSGPQLGQLAEEMYIAQLEQQLETKDQAQLWVKKWLKKHRAANEN